MKLRGKSIIYYAVLIVIFAVLLLLVLSKNKAKEKVYENTQAEKTSAAYPDFNPDSVARLTITSLQNGVVEFKKQDGNWLVGLAGDSPKLSEPKDKPPDELSAAEETGETTPDTEPVEDTTKDVRYFRADESQVVDGVLQFIKDMPRGVIVSHDPEKQNKEFQVSDLLGIEIKAEDADGNQLADFYVGLGVGMMQVSNYIRFPGKDEIWEVDQAWRNLVGKPMQAWRDKRMFYFYPEDIKSLKFVGTPDGDFELMRDDAGGWTCSAGWTPDPAKVDTELDKLSNLKASDFAQRYAERSELGLVDTAKKIIASGPEGTYELYIGNLGETGKYNCSTSGDETVFMVGEPDIKAVFTGKNGFELVAPAEPGPAPEVAPGPAPATE